MEKVDKSGDCWIWRGFIRKNGYGSFNPVSSGPAKMAHRLAYEISKGPIPPGLFVLHRCDNPPCVRPDHLFLGTPMDNMKDMISKGRQRADAPRGERNGNAKLSAPQILEIRRLAATGQTYASIGRDFGVTDALVGRIAKRLQWAHVTDPIDNG